MRLKTMLTPKSRFFAHSTRPLLPVLISLAANKLVEFKGLVTNGVSEYNNISNNLPVSGSYPYLN